MGYKRYLGRLFEYVGMEIFAMRTPITISKVLKARMSAFPTEVLFPFVGRRWCGKFLTLKLEKHKTLKNE